MQVTQATHRICLWYVQAEFVEELDRPLESVPGLVRTTQAPGDDARNPVTSSHNRPGRQILHLKCSMQVFLSLLQISHRKETPAELAPDPALVLCVTCLREQLPRLLEIGDARKPVALSLMEVCGRLARCCQCSQIVVFLGPPFQSLKPVHGLFEIPLLVIVHFSNTDIRPPHLLRGIRHVLNKLHVPKKELSRLFPMSQAAMGKTDNRVQQGGFSRLRVGPQKG